MKLYYFSGRDEDRGGVFVGADTWKEARNMALGHDSLHDCEFIDIRGSVCKEKGRPVHTEIKGEHEACDLIASGYTSFWWSGDCAKCGTNSERLNPIDGKLICSDCEDSDEDRLTKC